MARETPIQMLALGISKSFVVLSCANFHCHVALEWSALNPMASHYGPTHLVINFVIFYVAGESQFSLRKYLYKICRARKLKRRGRHSEESLITEVARVLREPFCLLFCTILVHVALLCIGGYTYGMLLDTKEESIFCIQA